MCFPDKLSDNVGAAGLQTSQVVQCKTRNLKEWVKEKWLAKGSRKGQREQRKIRRWLLF